MRITKIVQKLQKEFQRKQDLNNAYKLSKERREYQGDKTWIFGGPENGEWRAWVERERAMQTGWVRFFKDAIEENYESDHWICE